MRQTPPGERKIEISTAGNGDDQVRLSVRDHGAGISSEVRERLFDQFFTTKEHGLGMGLAIVRSIVEAHGGKIDAENVADGGARFYFTLPITKPPGRGPDGDAPSRSPDDHANSVTSKTRRRAPSTHGHALA